MSCGCGHNHSDPNIPCLCDHREHPRSLNIIGGMSHLDRKISTFVQFRNAMLSAIRNRGGVSDWRGNGKHDLGVMLLEMWAYICDSLSLYDRVIAQESYLRTALRRPSLRKLVSLIGYVPSPAVASQVYLSCIADGRQQVKLPQGTALRSGGFDGNPPQVFEIDQAGLIHPFNNTWDLLPVTYDVVRKSNPSALNVRLSGAVNIDDILLLTDRSMPSHTQPAKVTSINTTVENELGVVSISFQKRLRLPAGTAVVGLQLLTPTQSGAVWTRSDEKSIERVGDLRCVVLDKIYNQVKPGDYVIAKNSKTIKSFRVRRVTEELRKNNPEGQIMITPVQYSIPTSYTTVTALWFLERTTNTASDQLLLEENKAEVTVLFSFQPAATVVPTRKFNFAYFDPLFFSKKPEVPPQLSVPKEYLLSDRDMTGARIDGEINYLTSKLTQDPQSRWAPPLKYPVKVFGNVVLASRGETVRTEILGSGNASQPNQAFKLKKKPLTYISVPGAFNEHGIGSTLTVFVNGIKWKGVASFYRKGPTDQVYVVHHDDDEETLITFGDGVNGARVPSGRDNITASYRFGAGKAAPPAHKVNQIARPVTGLRSVDNITPAFGGDDREVVLKVRRHAPQSALLLGRAVSILDFEAASLAKPGVDTATAEWAWDEKIQRPVVMIWYAGERDIEDSLTSRLTSIADPSVPIVVRHADTFSVELIIDVKIDERYIIENVRIQINALLTDPDNGLLIPKNLGINRPLFRSQLYEVILKAEGTVAVESIRWNASDFYDFAMTAGPGKYFVFTTIDINPGY